MAITPCEDDISIPENEYLTHLDEQSHNHSQEKEDGCTAFCVCQCCGIPITIPLSPIFDYVNYSFLYSYLPHYSSSYSFDFCKGIWHPPTLS